MVGQGKDRQARHGLATPGAARIGGDWQGKAGKVWRGWGRQRKAGQRRHGRQFINFFRR